MLRQDIARTYELTSGHQLKRMLDCVRAPGVQAVVVLRFGQWILTQPLLVKLMLTPLYLVFNTYVKVIWGIGIGRKAKIGAGLYIGHFGGIFISPDAQLGENCNISQDVTIGVSGQGAKRGCPVIGDNVYMAPGSKAFGKIRIGNNVKIGANAVIHKDVPDNAIAVLTPGFTIIGYTDHVKEEVSEPAQNYTQPFIENRTIMSV